MKLLKLVCPHCEAPILVPRKAAHVTCKYCETPLQVQRAGDAYYAESIDALTDQVQALRDQNELLLLDKRWEDQLKSLMIKNSDGELSVPSKGTAIAAFCFSGAFVLVSVVMAFAGSGAGFGIFPLVFLGMGLAGGIGGLLTGISILRKSDEFAAAETEYHRKRRAIVARLSGQ